MKTKTIMVLLLTFVVGMAFVGSSSAATYYVNPGDSIQAAINDATSGDTIFVHAGTYTENVLIDKSLTLQGAGADMVTVQVLTWSYVFKVTADYVNISGFNVIGSSHYGRRGIWLSSTQYCNISDNNITNSEGGIELSYSSNNIISDNTLTNNDDGIYLGYSNNNTVMRNAVSGYSIVPDTCFGIYLANSVNNTIVDNNVSNNYVGIHSWYSNYNTFVNNTAFSNERGITLTHASNSVLMNNNVSNNHRGISVRDSSNNNLVMGNTASFNNDYGIYLYGWSDNNKLIGNAVSSNNDYGIYTHTSNNNTIYDNYFDNVHNVYDVNNNTWSITPTLGKNIMGGSYIGGNYWSDYIGEDTDGDGIGDTQTPYTTGILNGGDYHPLVLPIIDGGICYVYPGESIQEAIDG